jgi:hypothetical protein
MEEKYGIIYGGLVELIVNAMTNLAQPFLEDINIPGRVADQVPV